MVKGYAWREEQTRKKMAWLVAHLLAPYSKTPIKPDDLLKPLSDAAFEKVAGLVSPDDLLDAALEKQRKLKDSHGDR